METNSPVEDDNLLEALGELPQDLLKRSKANMALVFERRKTSPPPGSPPPPKGTGPALPPAVHEKMAAGSHKGAVSSSRPGDPRVPTPKPRTVAGLWWITRSSENAKLVVPQL